MPEYHDFWTRHQNADFGSAYDRSHAASDAYIQDQLVQQAQQEAAQLQHLSEARNDYQSYAHPTLEEEVTDYNPYAPTHQHRMLQEYDQDGIAYAAAQNAELMRRGYNSTPELEWVFMCHSMAELMYMQLR